MREDVKNRLKELVKVKFDILETYYLLEKENKIIRKNKSILEKLIKTFLLTFDYLIEKFFGLMVYIQPNSFYFLHQLAANYMRKHKFGEAGDLYKKALMLKPDDAFTYVKLGQVLIKQNKFHNAHSMFQKALKFDPKQQESEKDIDNDLNQYVKLLEEKLLNLIQKSKINKVMNIFKGISHRLAPLTNWKILEKCSRMLMEHGKFDNSTSLWKRVAKILPDPKTFFIEKKLEEIPYIKVNKFRDIPLDSDKIKRYQFPIKVNHRKIQDFNDLNGLLIDERRKLLQKDSRFKHPKWEIFNKYNLLTIPKTIFTGIKTPPSLTGHTPMSLDGYWIDLFTQGRPIDSVLQYQASQIKVNQYKRREGTVFVMPGLGFNKFFHAICNSFPALKIYKEMGLNCPIIFPKYPIEIQPNIKKIQSLLLKCLEIPSENVIRPIEISSVYFDVGIFPQALFPNNKRIAYFYQEISKKIENKIKIENQNPYIYISRRKSKRRTIINENEIIEMLESFGFTILEMSKLSFLEGYSIIRNASIIISPHGAGLTNLVFTKPGAKIIELHNLKEPSSIFYHLAKNCGHSYYAFLCSLSNNGKRALKDQDHKWKVDLNKLRDVLLKIL